MSRLDILTTHCAGNVFVGYQAQFLLDHLSAYAGHIDGNIGYYDCQMDTLTLWYRSIVQA